MVVLWWSLAVAGAVFAVVPEGGLARLPTRVAREAGGKVNLSASPPFFVRPLRLLKEALCFFSFLFISLDSALCESPQARQAKKGGYIHPPSLLV